MDKLNGRITQEFFDRQAATLRRELDGLLCKIQGIQKSALGLDANWEFGSPNFETWAVSSSGSEPDKVRRLDCSAR